MTTDPEPDEADTSAIFRQRIRQTIAAAVDKANPTDTPPTTRPEETA